MQSLCALNTVLSAAAVCSTMHASQLSMEKVSKVKGMLDLITVDETLSICDSALAKKRCVTGPNQVPPGELKHDLISRRQKVWRG